MSSERGVKEKGEAKTARIPIKIVPRDEVLRKPSWIRVKAGNDQGRFGEIKRMLREQKLHTVCEEASCPNIGECFGRGTATFMILGDICTRRCPFCDVGHGKPLPPDPLEPAHLAESVARLKLRYVVITSVDRDDLRDGGAQHFVDVIKAVREASPETTIETLVPDFRGRMDIALDILGQALPDVLNHNLETAPRLYKQSRPGADYAHSLEFLKQFKARYPAVSTKSGLMVGLGETDEEILDAMRTVGRGCGVFGEPAGVAGTAGLIKLCKLGKIPNDATVVSIVTGNGLKDTANGIKAAGEPVKLPPDMNLLREALK